LSYETEIVDSLQVGEGWTFICGHHTRFRPEADCNRVYKLEQNARRVGYKVKMKHFKGKRFRELAVVRVEKD
jgi:hypothetical protein